MTGMKRVGFHEGRGEPPISSKKVAAVREVWPEDRPLIAHFGVIEFDGRAKTLQDAIDLVGKFKAAGLHFLDTSLAGVAKRATWGRKAVVERVPQFASARCQPTSSL
ncbi:hypothetical protein [Rhizobium laguerreae]|uniref:hypothetical protein n=1 Tax=Rhizobium laguerreae TaxID=1076926 RepID=UPI001FEDA0E3|nr:hypothetical protein [Rhizobium laguerreae]